MNLGFAGWLLVSVLAVALWWFGYIATRRMRQEKNRKREALRQKILAEKQAEKSDTPETSPQQEAL